MLARSFAASLASALASANVVEFLQQRETPNSVTFPSINVKINGEETTLYMAADYHIDSPNPEKLTIPMGQGGELSWSPSLDPDQYFKPNLLGASIDYDVDLSSSVCGCVAAFYTVSMPGRKSSGELEPADWGIYYCDANKVNGNFCPEFDIMEANIYAMATTPHTCDAPNEHGFYDRCDMTGSCGKNTRWAVPENSFGPGDWNKINTYKPFHVHIQFKEENGSFVDYLMTLTQEGRTLDYSGGCRDTTAAMTEDLRNGMVFAISHWKGDIDWLVHGACADFSECGSPTLVYTNIEFNLAH